MRILKSTLAVLLCVACSATGAREFTSIGRGIQGSVVKPCALVARTQAEFDELWKNQALSFDPSAKAIAMPPCAVDFEREMVVRVCDGERPTVGWSLHVNGVEERDGTLVIRVTVVGPPRDHAQAQIVTSPYEFIVVPRSDLPIELEVDRLQPNF